MEPLLQSRPEAAFQRCQEADGLPLRLVGESDVFTLPVGEELRIDSDDASLGDAAHQRGVRARVTTHRLYWKSAAAEVWLAVRLDGVIGAECLGGFLRARACVLQLQSGGTLSVRAPDAARTDELRDQVAVVVREARWLQGSFEASSMGGLQAILARKAVQRQAVEESLDLALADLKSLRQYAADTAAIARRVAQRSAEPGEAAGVQKLLEEFGLLGADGKLVAGPSLGAGLSEEEADVERVCVAALERRGGFGMMLAHDVFCLVNRARGTAQLSPEEVMSAIKKCCRPGGRLLLKSLGSTGALAVSLASTNQARIDEKLLSLAQEWPLSAFRVATALQITASEAQYLLRDAESRAVVIRDDAHDGLYFYRNFFDDF